jgi:hypothetical protein
MEVAGRHTDAPQSPGHVGRMQSRICRELGQQLMRRRLLRATYLVHRERPAGAGVPGPGAIGQDQSGPDDHGDNDRLTNLNAPTPKTHVGATS